MRLVLCVAILVMASSGVRAGEPPLNFYMMADTNARLKAEEQRWCTQQNPAGDYARGYPQHPRDQYGVPMVFVATTQKDALFYCKRKAFFDRPEVRHCPYRDPHYPNCIRP